MTAGSFPPVLHALKADLHHGDKGTTDGCIVTLPRAAPRGGRIPPRCTARRRGQLAARVLHCGVRQSQRALAYFQRCQCWQDGFEDKGRGRGRGRGYGRCKGKGSGIGLGRSLGNAGRCDMPWFVPYPILPILPNSACTVGRVFVNAAPPPRTSTLLLCVQRGACGVQEEHVGCGRHICTSTQTSPCP